MLIETQLSEVFDADLFVPSISSMSSLEIILREVELFPSDDECTRALSQIGEIGFGTKVTGRGTRMETPHRYERREYEAETGRATWNPIVMPAGAQRRRGK